CAIVVTGTSITSEAKGKKSSKKAVATTYSSNAVVNDFVATGIKSDGLTIGGKSYNTQQVNTLGHEANPAVTVSPLCYQEDYELGHFCYFNLCADGSKGVISPKAELIYGTGTSSVEMNDMAACGYTQFLDDAVLSTNGVWNTDAFIANGVNVQYICAWMQSRGLNTASDIYNYLVANGATFTEVATGDATSQAFACNQCPELKYYIYTDSGETGFKYINENLSGVNLFDINTSTERTTGYIKTYWTSGIQH
ncbi:hypothetical protein SAMN04487830_1791, partial [Pseudobutyrivibrio sp. OR37]|uniref:hypothetical protein n=1 Tax=Pseudobutyrivibrio sp. OR37 TaxID=1798186 RepID=UPI0008E108C8